MTVPGDARDDDVDDVPLGEVPEGLGPDLYPRHLESLSRDPAFGDGVLSFTDDDGVAREVAFDDVDSARLLEPGDGGDEGKTRTKIILRSGVVVVATGAVVAGAIAAVRYRRRKRS